MKCKNCGDDVPQKFAHAISVNICPLCGGEIMDSDLQVALHELREVMQATEQYRAEMLDWLRSNYNLVSIESDDYKALLEKAAKADFMMTKPVPRSGRSEQLSTSMVDVKQVTLDNDGNQIEGEVLQDQETTNVFLQRASAAKLVDKNKHYRDIINQIKKSGSTAVDASGGVGVITPEMFANADSNEVAEMESLLSGGSAITSAIDTDFDDGDEALPAVVQAMVKQAGAPNNGTYNPRDVAKLQELQNKSARAKNALDRGGSVGLIRR